jgi:PAS domain S-box-containing protein
MQHRERGFEIEFRILRPDGEARWVVCRSTIEQRAGREIAVGIHLDVTERRATQAELARQQERLEMATRAAGMGVWERDADGATAFWDAQMYRLRGIDPGDPRSFTEISAAVSDPALDRELRNRARRCMATGEPYEHEFRCVWPDGSEHWIVSVGTARRDAQGRATGMIGINLDVTQRKRAEQALRERDAADRANRTKSEFLARMSHELRTPLNAVLGFAQLIEHDGLRGLPPQQLERVSRIRTAGQHLLSLIEDVLDLAAVEAGTLPIVVEAVALDDALEEVWQWVAPLADRHGVRLHRKRSDCWIAGDPRRVRQVFANLLTNAVKYNRAGGNVWVEVGAGGDGRRVITVRDDGRGLTAQQREHLFEPFNRLGAENDSVEGVGLGLVVVRRLVESMGGTIRVDSAPGSGTAMHVDFAAATRPARGGSEAPAPTTASGADDALAILYIEDNPVNVLLVEELVALRSNMRVSSAPDGQSGVRMALAERPDVVLIDMQLPDFDGYEVLRRLRRASSLGGCRMIALSANAMPEDVARAKAAGFDDYWTKPIDFTRFLDGLDALARARSAVA